MDIKTKRRYAERVRASVSKHLRQLGFQRTKSTFWTRPRDQVIEFIHLHLYTFAPKFRIHLGIRVLNDTFEAEGLNGPDSHGEPYRPAFDASDASVETCSAEVLRYCTDVGEPWFTRWRDLRSLVVDKESPLHDHDRIALQAALDGKVDAANVERSQKMFGVA